MKKILPILILILSVLLPAKKTVIKLATLAPKGSDMHSLMVEMGQRWTAATNEEIILRIYPNGVVGDERDMIRKIRIGQIHAAAVSTEGLSVISTDVYGFLIPLLFEDFDDVDWVRDRITPELEKDFYENGFVILNWGDVGWAYWFTKTPLRTQDDLKGMHIFTWAGDYHTPELWKNAGFTSVQLAYLDALSGLQTGLIDAISVPPIIALSSQFFGPANHMLDMKWGLVTGGTVIYRPVWEKIKPEYREAMMTIAKEIGLEQQKVNRKIDGKAIETMREYGLEVYQPTVGEMQAWKELTRSFYPDIRGSLIPTEIFDRVIDLKALKDSLDAESAQ
ncbi:MAG: TRAP transporter substrate-binding protein DctP [Candidatus Marinimicrobia bacterium]|nr:TRAP transporter substrate-binding protein DctP [Candidatus Neomarinimicrobiota bacterium]